MKPDNVEVSNKSSFEMSRRSGRREFLRSVAFGGGILLSATSALLTGCGGGGRSGTPNSSSSGSNGNNGNGGGLDTAKRLAALSAVESFANGLAAGLTKDQFREQVLAFLASRPEFVRSGISSDGCVWGTFADGRRFTIIANRFREPGDTTGLTAGRRITRAQADSLPRSGKAYVLSGMGDYLPTCCESVGAWLADAGYILPIPAGAPATVANLRSIQGAGVLHLSTHGAAGDTVAFELSTATEVTEATENDPIIQQELKDRLLVYAMVPLEVSWGGFGDVKYVKVYAITPGFIEKYMTFGENSLVYMDACSSDELSIKSQCFKKGASLYLGWTAPVRNGDANRDAQFVFDRLLGANKEPLKEDPAQRPFDHIAAQDDLKKRGFGVSPGETGKPTAELIFSTNIDSREFGLLDPSIKFVNVSEQKATLTLVGMFGHDAGRVTVDGTELAIQSWTPDEIVCTLPLKGAGSAGDVQVEVRQHRSNIRTLSEWKTTFRYEMTGPGTLQKKMDLMVRWRGDIGPYREKPGETPRYREVNCDFTTDSTASASGTGSYSDSFAKYTWKGEVFLPYFVGDDPIPNGSSGFIGNVVLKPEAGVMELYIGGSGKGTGSTWIIPHKAPATELAYTAYFPVDAYAPPVRFTMKRGGKIPADTKNGDTFAEPFSQFPAKAKLTWDDIEPRFPPRKETARSR